MTDLRQFIKTVCCVPRHPGQPRPGALRGMPHTLSHLRKFAVGARAVLEVAQAAAMLDGDKVVDGSDGGSSGSGNSGGEGGGGGRHSDSRAYEGTPLDVRAGEGTPLDVVRQLGTSRPIGGLAVPSDKVGRACRAELELHAAVSGVGSLSIDDGADGGFPLNDGRQLGSSRPTSVEEVDEADEADGMGPLLHVMEGIEACGWPAHFCNVILQVLIAKGAAKALWMHAELKRGQRHFAAYLADLQVQVNALELQPTVDDVVAGEPLTGCGKPLVAAAMRAHRQINLLHGAIAALADQVPWLTRMAEVPAERLFLAGDDDLRAGTSMFLPRGFTVPLLFDQHRVVADSWRPRMRAALAADGWPAHLRDRLGHTARGERQFVETTCRICTQSFSNLWVHPKH